MEQGVAKNAIAKVWLRDGSGQIVVNGRSLHEYLTRPTLEVLAVAPLVTTNLTERFDVVVKCLGGGNSGQAGAMRHGLARALVQFDETFAQATPRARLPHARPACKRAEEVRSQTRPPRLPVLQALGVCRVCASNIHEPGQPVLPGFVA